jgi:putative two-component system response regulator
VAAFNHITTNGFLREEVGATVLSGHDADAVMVRVALTVEARDPGTAEHCHRLSAYATALGRRIGLCAGDLATLRQGAYLHDVGKIAIPGSVLQKRGALSREERTLVEQHPLIGDRLCAAFPALRHLRPIVRYHHERLDGSGYPDKLRGDAIPLLARIVGIVDVFDALMAERPYKPAMSFDRAAEVLRVEAARGWHCADLVGLFLRVVSDEGDAVQLRERRAGGGRGIRTPGTLSGSTVFKTAALNRSAIPPHRTIPVPSLARAVRS